MTHLLQRQVSYTCSLFLLLAIAPAAAEDRAEPVSQTAVLPTMDWGQIRAAMEAYPPSYAHGDQRHMIMRSMDRLVYFSVKHITPDERAKVQSQLDAIVRFYRYRVDCGLDALENTKVPVGVHVFKFYSSSFVLKSRTGTVALDFCQGPVNNGGEPEQSDLYRTGFYMTRAQRDRLASLVDILLITHRHHDHADYSLAKRMIEQGKTVVGPAQLKLQWPDLAAGITVADYDRVQQFKPCEILTHFGYQFATSRVDSTGQQVGEHIAERPERSSETVRYLIRIGDFVFLQSGESHTDALEWLRSAQQRGWEVDVLFSPGQYQGARSVMAFLKDREYFRLPLHEYELTHQDGGNRTRQLLDGSGRRAFEQKKSMPLLWGEDFLLTKE